MTDARAGSDPRDSAHHFPEGVPRASCSPPRRWPSPDHESSTKNDSPSCGGVEVFLASGSCQVGSVVTTTLLGCRARWHAVVPVTMSFTPVERG
ncbi:MAG: hypothetical protein Q4D89_15175 [Arachnia propionica]|uniref:hypothetical protein n=1 Tax=Arachnia propionica TaxID=1750 RepID=UPI002706CFFC|nr:hypothetical protein [Arachnia propionica]